MEEKDDLFFVEQCTDYQTIKEHLTKKELLKVESVLTDYHNFQCYSDNGIKDIYDDYIYKFGNSNIIEWYEGLKTTKKFLEDFKLEGGDDYVL